MSSSSSSNASRGLSRRSALLRIGAPALALVLPLAGCGFRLRGRFEAPFETLYLQMGRNERFTALLKQSIEAGSSERCVDSMREADAILSIVSTSRSRDVLTYNDTGHAREYELTLRITFRCDSPDGFEFVPATTLATTRNLPYTESEFLSREKEEEILYRDMENDLIVQMVRRLAAARSPDRSAGAAQ